jgi:hypothetical protein
VLCNFGALGANASCAVRLAVRPGAVGNLTNFAEAWRAEGERYLQNNSVETVTRVDYPWLSIGSVSKSEGNTTNIFTFPVVLSDPVKDPVTVRYYTSNGTAVAGSDYLTTSGTLTFSNGVISNLINVTIRGNLQAESNKTFFVYLADPTNAILANSPAQGTIQNDDFFLNGSVTLSDAMVVEGDDGVTNAVFRVTLSQAQAKPASVYYETRDGTATAGLDYVATWGRLDFLAGVTNGTITVGVLGDRLLESNETFYVKIDYADSLYIVRQGVGTIVDDDSDLVDHFAWSIPGTNQWIEAPFSATLYAVDGAGRAATNYNGPVKLLAGRQYQQITIGTGTNLLEYPFGTGFQDSRLQVLYPAAGIGRAGRITAVGLRLATLPGQTLHGWTLRMKAMSESNFSSTSSWESFEAGPVLQRDESLASGGWVTFPLQNSFNYDGTNSLLVDFSFNNWESSSDGLCFATRIGANERRAMGLRSDSFFGDPLNWAGAHSAPWTNLSSYPNIRLTMDTAVGIGISSPQDQSFGSTPSGTVNLVDGVWSGALMLEQSGPDVFLLAQDDQGHIGTSGLLHLMGTSLRVELLGNSVRISFPTSLGERYQIESAEQLVPISWTPISGVIEGQGEVYHFTNSISESSVRFYRVSLAP